MKGLATLLVGLLVVPVACGDGGSRKTLVVYSPHGGDILEQFEKAFERENPDVDVVTVYAGARRILERIRAERKNPQAAVWWGADSTTFETAADEGLLHPYRPSYADERLPADPLYRWTGAFLLPIVLGYHPDRFKPGDLPRRWQDLGDPRYKGRIVLREPAQSGTMATFIAAMIADSIARTGAEDEGWKLLAAIDRNVRQYIASPELMFEELEHGPPAITVWNLTDLVFQKRQRGYHFAAAGLDEPVPNLLDGIALVKGPGERPEARAFYEFVNTPQSLAILAREHARIPVRPGFDEALLLDEIRAVPVVPMRLDREVLARRSADWMKRFEEQIRGGARK